MSVSRSGPLTMKHMAEAAGAAAELWRDVRPEAEAKHAKHGCIRAQADHQSRTATCTKIRYRSVARYRSVQEIMRTTCEACSTHERTVRHQAVHRTPQQRHAGRDGQNNTAVAPTSTCAKSADSAWDDSGDKKPKRADLQLVTRATMAGKSGPTAVERAGLTSW